jgi:hypothetical protein
MGANVDCKGRGYRAAIYQTARACNLQTVEVTLYLNGRAIPEAQLPHVRRAVVAAYVGAFGLLPHDMETVPAPAAPVPIKIGRKVETIDCTPTWESLVPALLACIENGNATSRAFAMGELSRMARIADAYVAAHKAA